MGSQEDAGPGAGPEAMPVALMAKAGEEALPVRREAGHTLWAEPHRHFSPRPPAPATLSARLRCGITPQTHSRWFSPVGAHGEEEGRVSGGRWPVFALPLMSPLSLPLWRPMMTLNGKASLLSAGSGPLEEG